MTNDRPSLEIQQIINSNVLLTKDEERELLARAQDGDEEARDELISRNLGLVAKNARYYQAYTTIPFEDLFQEGIFGLFSAINKFDLDKEWRLSTYATWWIRHFIGRHMTNHGRTVRIPSSIIDLKREYLNTREEFMKDFGYEPTTEEMSAAMGVSVAKIEEMQVFMAPISSLDFKLTDNKNGGSDAGTLGELIPDNSESIEDTVVKEDAIQRLRDAIKELGTLEQVLLTKFFMLDGSEKRPTKSQLVKELNMSGLNQLNTVLSVALKDLKTSLSDLEGVEEMFG